MNLLYVDRVPTPEEHRRLAESVGWTHAFDFYVQDVVVLPELQGQGIGDDVLRRLVAHVDEIAPPKAFIGLFAAGESPRFHERHAFAGHKGVTGMFRAVPGTPGVPE